MEAVVAHLWRTKGGVVRERGMTTRGARSTHQRDLDALKYVVPVVVHHLEVGRAAGVELRIRAERDAGAHLHHLAVVCATQAWHA